MIRVALNGANGRMCRVIYDLIQKREDCKVVVGFDINDTPYADFPIYKNREEFDGEIDVIIDFSHVNGVREVLDYAAPRAIQRVRGGRSFSFFPPPGRGWGTAGTHRRSPVA